MKNLEIAEKSSTLYNLGGDGNNDIWFNVNKHKAGREAEIEAAREIMKRHNMHDKLVEKLKLVVGNSTVQSTIPDLCEEIETLLTQAKGE